MLRLDLLLIFRQACSLTAKCSIRAARHIHYDSVAALIARLTNLGARHQQSLIIHGPEGGREPTRVTQHKPVESRTPVVQLNACYGLKQLQRCSNAQLVSARQSVAAGWVVRAPYRTRGTDRSNRVRVSVTVRAPCCCFILGCQRRLSPNPDRRACVLIFFCMCLAKL